MNYAFNVMSVTGGKIMQKSITVFVIMFFSGLFAVQSRAEIPLKIKFVQSVYAGAEETGLQSPEGIGCTDDYFIVADTGNDRLVKLMYENNVAKAAKLEITVTSPLITQINSRGDIYTLDGRDRRIFIASSNGLEKGYLSPKASPVARKMLPRSFRIDSNDNIYVLDISEGLVLVLDPEGRYVRHIPFPDEYGFFSDLAVDEQGIIYIVDSVNPAIYSTAAESDKFTLITRNLQEFVNFPANITLGPQGIIFLMDKHGGNLALLSRSGSFLGHKFSYGWKESQFYYPAQICISPGGSMFVADRNNNRVQIFAIEQ